MGSQQLFLLGVAWTILIKRRKNQFSKRMSAEWKQGLCGCCDDCATCCCGCFCTPCQVYQNGEDLNKSGILCCLGYLFMPCIPIMLLRTEAREKYGIEGSSGGDCVASCCCGPCASIQTANEIKSRGDHQ